MADNRIAYGLAKKYGIDTSGMTPKEVWAALKEKGVTEPSIADGAYNSQDNKAKAASKTVNERRKDLVKKYSDEPEKDIKALEQPSERLSKAEYAKVSKAIAEKYATAVRNKQKLKPTEVIFTADNAYIVKINPKNFNNFKVLYSISIEGNEDKIIKMLGVD